MRCVKKGKVPVQYAWRVGRAGSLPLPPLRWRSRVGGGGGEGWLARSCLGILSGEGGSLVSKPRVEMAGFQGQQSRRVFEEKKRQKKEKKMILSRSVNCIMIIICSQ